MKKYEFTGKEIRYLGRTLKQIIRIEDGLVGGYIEKEENLSHVGDAMVYDNAMVYGNARVSDNARVYDNAMVYDNAIIYDNARISGDARVYGNAKAYGDARISGDEYIIGEVQTEFDEIFFFKSGVSRMVTVIKKDDEILFNVGCQKLITAEEFEERIYGEDGGIKRNPHRQFYLDILKIYK